MPNACRPLQMIHSFDRWPGKTVEAMRNRIHELKDAGLGGLVVNVSFKDYLLDKAAWATFRRGVRIAHQEGMRIWIYDEEGYPSGAAGGRVLAEAPLVEAQGLIRVVDRSRGVRYETIRLYEGTHATENFYQKRPCINILDPRAVATFLAVTHDRYAAALKPIARYVEAFFTDEPSLNSVYIPENRNYPKTLPWYAELPAEFKVRKGYDLLPHLESLFINTGPIDRKVRCDFYSLVAELCGETFFGGLQKWCRRHNVASTGHLLGEETMAWQTIFNGEPFACYRNLDIPGIDMIISNPEKIMQQNYFMVPKVAGSACRLQGSRRLMCEISDFFGRRDKDYASIEQMKCTAGILFSFGVTDLCSYYGLSFIPEEALKPGVFNVPTYRRYTEFVSRLKLIFTARTIETRVAVLYPILSLQAQFTPSTRSMYEPHPRKDINFIDGAFTGLCRSLLQQQIDYDMVDETSMATADIDEKTLALGERRYDVIVLPPMDTIRVSTMVAIDRFAQAGGTIIGHARLPKYAADGQDKDTSIRTTVRRLRRSGSLLILDTKVKSIGRLVKPHLALQVKLSPMRKSILYTALKNGAGTSYFLVNVSAKRYEGSLTMPGAGTPVLHDPATGKERWLRPQKTKHGQIRVLLKLRPFESLLVDFR